LGSGSAGNCTLVESEATRVLVDAGLSGRQVTRRLESVGRQVDQIDGVILTHEHSDHTRGLTVLCRNRSLPVYANRLTAEGVTTDGDLNGRTRVSWHLFATGSPFEVGDLVVESFSVPHDAYDPVGFVISQRHGGARVGVLTDLGHPTKLVIERVRGVDILVLEANHDLKLLQEDTARPWATKQRIMSRHGHLCNDDAANVVREVAWSGLRHVFLAHLSQDCNRPELAQQVVSEPLRKGGTAEVTMTVSSQSNPTPTRGL